MLPVMRKCLWKYSSDGGGKMLTWIIGKLIERKLIYGNVALLLLAALILDVIIIVNVVAAATEIAAMFGGGG